LNKEISACLKTKNSEEVAPLPVRAIGRSEYLHLRSGVSYTVILLRGTWVAPRLYGNVAIRIKILTIPESTFQGIIPSEFVL
jgi:hypothetical protein